MFFEAKSGLQAPTSKSLSLSLCLSFLEKYWPRLFSTCMSPKKSGKFKILQITLKAHVWLQMDLIIVTSAFLLRRLVYLLSEELYRLIH